MDRRNFIKSSGLAAITPALHLDINSSNLIPTKPKAFNHDKKIGLIAPSSALTRSAFEKTLTNIESLGFKVRYSEHIRTRSGFLSGTDKDRIEDIHTMFSDSEIGMIICARGGYGCTRIIDGIDYKLIRENPKPIIGYSDITALLLAFYKKCGLVGFHGPVGASTFNDFSVDYIFDILSKGKKVKIKCDKPLTITGGVTEGRLIGGNLTLLSSLIGTPFDVDYSGHIVFIEEVGEASYKVDRMLTQMISAGKFKNASGIALGYFTNCDTKPDDPFYEYSIGLMEVFKERLGNLGIPVVFGFPFGHEEHNATIPIGIKARLDADKGLIKMLESAVS